MKKIVVIIALTLFLKPIFPVLEYVVNYDYITKVLCVNKDKPMMHCNGKCHLMKQLAKAAENDKPITPTKKGGTEELETIFYLNAPTIEVPKAYCIASSNVTTFYNNLYDYATVKSVFHPPTV